MRKYFLAVILLFFASPAWAQCTTLPFTLLNGVAADGGQVMADLNALNNGCLPLGQRGGTTILYLPPGATNPTVAGTVITPDGGVPAGLATTVTMGFNEVEAYDFQNGYSTWVIGTGEFSGEGANPERSYLKTNDAGGFVLKPLANRFVRFSTILVICNGAANSGCINVDSMMKGRIILEGGEAAQQVTSANSGTCTFYMNPHTPVPNEGVTGIVDSVIDLGNVSNGPHAAGTGQSSLCINLATGPFNNNLVRAAELNSQNASAYGMVVYGSTGTYGFSGNIIDLAHVHLSKTAAVQVATTTTNQALYAVNLWRLGSLYPTTGDGFNSYARNDIADVGIIGSNEGALTNAVVLQSGAINNNIRVGSIAGASGSNLVNTGGATNTVMNGAAFIAPASVTCGAGFSATTGRSVNGIVTAC